MTLCPGDHHRAQTGGPAGSGCCAGPPSVSEGRRPSQSLSSRIRRSQVTQSWSDQESALPGNSAIRAETPPGTATLRLVLRRYRPPRSHALPRTHVSVAALDDAQPTGRVALHLPTHSGERADPWAWRQPCTTIGVASTVRFAPVTTSGDCRVRCLGGGAVPAGRRRGVPVRIVLTSTAARVRSAVQAAPVPPLDVRTRLY